MKKKKSSKLNFGHSLVFEQSKGLKEKFDKLIKSEPALIIHSDSIIEIDLTGVQLIQYCIVQAEMLGKELSFSLKIAEEPRSVLLKNGFSQLLATAFA